MSQNNSSVTEWLDQLAKGDKDVPARKLWERYYQRLVNALWVPLLEKAFAQFRSGQNSYASIEAGWMGEGYTAITGHGDKWLSTSVTPADSIGLQIQAALNAGQAVTAATYNDSTGMIVASHADEIRSITYDSVKKAWSVTVYNP